MRPAIFTVFEDFGDTCSLLVTASTNLHDDISIQPDIEKPDEQNHLAAATALARRKGWSGTLVGGRTERGMVWVFADLEQLSHYVPGAPDGWQCVGTDHD